MTLAADGTCYVQVDVPEMMVMALDGDTGAVLWQWMNPVGPAYFDDYSWGEYAAITLGADGTLYASNFNTGTVTALIAAPA